MLWQLLADSAGVLLGGLLLIGVLLVSRRRFISRRGGTFDLSVRTGSIFGQGWAIGVGRYDADKLRWFRIFTLVPRASGAWARSELAYVGQRVPQEPESLSLYPGDVVVKCSTADGELEFAMSPQALTGFQSWLEAGPPSDPALRRP